MKNVFDYRERSGFFGTESDVPPRDLEEREALDSEWAELGWQSEWGESAWESEAKGNSRDFIRWVQSSLNKVLGTRLTVDGIMGSGTRSAIRSFQQQRGLIPDGIVGSRTEEALRVALGGGASVPATTPCTTLDGFRQGTDTITPAHQPILIALARQILAKSIRNVEVTGFASSEGTDAENLALGQRRAERVARELRITLERIRRGSSRAVTLVTTSRGERQQIASGNLQLNRRVTICLKIPRPTPKPTPVVPTRTQVFRVTGKSFIARIGSKFGSLDCGIDTPFGRIPGASNPALRALATLTDAAFGEDPGTDAIFTAPPPEGKGYRLFSQGNIEVVHRASEILSVSLRGSITTDAGKECVPTTGLCLQTPPLTIDQPFRTERISSSAVRFRWGVKGRPREEAEPGFQAICRRDCHFIWHQIKGILDSSTGTPVMTSLVIEGSRFPSHRVWVDGVERLTVPQGPFSNLWDCDPSDTTRVR